MSSTSSRYKIRRCSCISTVPGLLESIQNWGWLERSKLYWWVAYGDDGWVGYAAASIYDLDTLYCGPTFVKPEARGRSLQLKLLKKRESFARKEGYSRLITAAEKFNTHSINNILKAGFQPIKQPGYDGDGIQWFAKEI